jgi:hypothetical protein
MEVKACCEPKKKTSKQRKLERCHEIADANDGACLSEEYSSRMKFQCKRGHVWYDTLRHAEEYWCKKCRKIERYYQKNYVGNRKRCSKCGILKPTYLFYKPKGDYATPDGFSCRCIECDSSNGFLYRNRRVYGPVGYRECRECGEVKEVDKFRVGDNICKMCTNGWTEERVEEILPEGYKKCNGCGEAKVLDDFYNWKHGKFGKQSQCKVCQRKEKVENWDHYREYHREYYRERHPNWNISKGRSARRMFSDDQVREMREIYSSGGISYVKLAQKYNCSESTIERIIRREYYKDVE